MKSFGKVILGLSTAALLVSYPALSYADEGHRGGHEDHHYYHYNEHPQWGLRISWIPETVFSISLGGSRFYYYDGLYYERVGSQYVLVTPPIGAVVREIPRDYQPVIINGVTYYVDNGIYYVYTRSGYQVVPTPAQFIQPIVVSPQPAAITQVQQVSVASGPSDADESFSINIPNAQSGYTTVLLKRSGKGFVGPQGEFYSEFPRVSQLRVMYGK